MDCRLVFHACVSFMLLYYSIVARCVPANCLAQANRCYDWSATRDCKIITGGCSNKQEACINVVLFASGICNVCHSSQGVKNNSSAPGLSFTGGTAKMELCCS
eukprot:GHVU01035337.1.p2 GENE.GHVU01035337.1~~GHVU01035337.1.p2  ORF type:complete len:103 (+),score=3.15 GHVU01035337.1:5358-5666(+)